MKYTKCYIALLLALALLLLTACQITDPQDQGSSTPETSESTQTEASQTENTEGTEDSQPENTEGAEDSQPENTEGTEDSQPDPTEQTWQTEEEALLAKLDALFGDWDSWYNITLTSFYETPEQIDLKCFVNNSLIPQGDDLTDEEYAFVSNYTTLLWMDIRRIYPADIEEVLQQYLGIGLEDLESPAYTYLPYWEETGCYYLIANDVDYTYEFHAESVEILEDGTICMTYTCSFPDTPCVARLMPYGDGYRVLSNLQITE